MQEFDKPLVLPSDVEEIMRLTGLGTPLTFRFLGGVPNVTIGTKTELGEYAVRVCNNGYTSEIHLECELSLLEYLESKDFPYSPRLVRNQEGVAIHIWRGYRVFAMRLIDGVSADNSNLNSEGHEQLGRIVGDLTGHLKNFIFPLPSSESFLNRSNRLLHDFSDNCNVVNWSFDSELVLGEWNQYMQACSEIFSKGADRVCHTDLWPPNVIVKNGNVMGIIDFDDLALAPPVWDIATTLAEFALNHDCSLDSCIASRILRGYFESHGCFSTLEAESLIPAMLGSSAAWLACNALHRVEFSSSELYYLRIVHFQKPRNQEALWEEISGAIEYALL